MKDREGTVATDVCGLENVTIVEGRLTDQALIARLFEGSPNLAFLNTVHWGGEVAIGKALADAAKRVGVKHVVYSSMPDYHAMNPNWENPPMWDAKVQVEKYIREIGLPATFVYSGLYHNNFTTLEYPMFGLKILEDGSFVWPGPFPPDKSLPWVDAETDFGPAVLQIFKDGPQKWGGRR